MGPHPRIEHHLLRLAPGRDLYPFPLGQPLDPHDAGILLGDDGDLNRHSALRLAQHLDPRQSSPSVSPPSPPCSRRPVLSVLTFPIA